MKSAKVSIIIPTFNSEKYIQEAIESVIVQTLKNIEIILVDSNSTDKTLDIINEYAKNDSRIKILHRPIEFVGMSRNAALDFATGDYIMFLDSDDMLVPDACEEAYNQISRNNDDIVIFDMFEYFENTKERRHLYSKIKNLSEYKNGASFNLCKVTRPFLSSAESWYRIYNRSFLNKNNIRFSEEKFCEDIPFSFKSCILASSVSVLNKPLYIYRIVPSSSTTSCSLQHWKDVLTSRTKAYEIVLQSPQKEAFLKLFLPYFINSIIYWYKRWSKIKKFDKKGYYNEMHKFFAILRKKHSVEILAKKNYIQDYKFYKQVSKENWNLHIFRKILKQIFSITNDDRNLHKVVKFLGIKIKIRKITSASIVDMIFRKPKIFRLIDNILPKNCKQILFYASPDFGDNTKAFYDYLIKISPQNYNCFIFVYGNKWWEKNLERYKYLFTKTQKQQCKFVYLYSIEGLLALFTSKTYVINEAFRSWGKNLSKKHTIINLWHGMPIKTIGFVEKNIEKDVLADYKFLGENSYLFVTSDIFKALMSNAFMAKPEQIFITGYPRNDNIIENDKAEIFNKHLEIQNFDKVILYTPTYREFCRKFDVHQAFKNIFYCDDYIEKDFYSYLEKNNILLIFKPHLFDENFYKKMQGKINFNHPNIRYIGDIFFKKTNTTLYELFKYTDVLISDFSSITVDYLISGKPVIYLLSGADNYAQERGFSLEDNYKIFMPGLKANNFAELQSAIGDALYADSTKEERLKALPLMHKYVDSNACERIWEIMQRLM